MKHYSSKIAVVLLFVALSVSAQAPATEESLEKEYGVPLTMEEKRLIIKRILDMQLEMDVMMGIIEKMQKHIQKLQASTNCA